MPYGSGTYGGAPYGGSSDAISVNDGFAISDSATATPGRFTTDAWGVTDIAQRVHPLSRTTGDAVVLSDGAAATRASRRSTADSFTVADSTVVWWAPYGDLPTQNPIEPTIKLLVIEPTVKSNVIESTAKSNSIEPTVKELALNG